MRQFLAIIGSDNGLSPGRLQVIIGNTARILLIQTLGTNFSKILSEIDTFLFKKCIWKCGMRNGDKFVSASMRDNKYLLNHRRFRRSI